MNEKNNEKKIIEKLDEYKEIYKNKSNEIENVKQIGKEKIKDINDLNKDNIIIIKNLFLIIVKKKKN